MDMLNDDAEAVRLQTLQTLFHMATHDRLMVQEKHMDMVCICHKSSVNIRASIFVRSTLSIKDVKFELPFRSVMSLLLLSLVTII